MFPSKFCSLNDSGDHVRHDYGNLFFEQPCGSTSRLVIGPSRGQVSLLLDLAAEFAGSPWYVLYVLLVPRRGARGPGRYASPGFDDHRSLSEFLRSFGDFFEGDGRHHVWIASPADGGLLVYDQHDVIFAYGPLGCMRAALEARGFSERTFWFPAPHSHSFSPAFDGDEERLMQALDWECSELQPGDEWS